MKYLTKRIIIRINQKTIDKHGGNYVPPSNFLHEEALDYLIEAVASEMFGTPLYPDLEDKAALYFFNIIANHVFQDGNKRTGLEAALLFLALNGFELKNEFRNPEQTANIEGMEALSVHKILENFVLDTASGKFELDYCKSWFKRNIQATKK